jgi:hypothetical protein
MSDHTLPVIMAVDDDPVRLQGLMATLDDRYGRHYEIIAAPSPTEATSRLMELRGRGADVAMVVALVDGDHDAGRVRGGRRTNQPGQTRGRRCRRRIDGGPAGPRVPHHARAAARRQCRRILPEAAQVALSRLVLDDVEYMVAVWPGTADKGLPRLADLAADLGLNCSTAKSKLTAAESRRRPQISDSRSAVLWPTRDCKMDARWNLVLEGRSCTALCDPAQDPLPTRRGSGMSREVCPVCGAGRLASFRYCRACGFDFERTLHDIRTSPNSAGVFEWAAGRRAQSDVHTSPATIGQEPRSEAGPRSAAGPRKTAISEIQLLLILVAAVAGLGAAVIAGALFG